MKTNLLAISLTLLSLTGFSQNNIPLATGRVGIGTAQPLTTLHILDTGTVIDRGSSSQIATSGLIIQANTGGRLTTSGAQLTFAIPANTNGTNVWGQARIITVAGTPGSADATGKLILGVRRSFNKLGTGTEWYYGDDIVIAGSGFVGIGTLTPKEMLSVNGKVRAKEIKVESTNWPDYVFSKEYQLPTLQEMEDHIKQNGHLSGIPSAEEVKTNGIDLGEMNAKLLKKIEELTLHIISLEKRVKSIENK